MKHPLTYLTLALLAICCCISPTESLMEEAILEFLEELRVRMCHPLPKLGVPALDPMQFSHLDYEANNKYFIDLIGSVDNFRLTGLSDFVVNDLKITTVPLRRSTIDVTLPLTAFKSLYTLKGSLAYIVNLAGDGNAEASIDKFRLAVSWIFKTGLTLGIRSLTITIEVGGIEINFEKLIEEERINDFVHALVNELGLELLDDVWKAENKYVEEVVEEQINNFIGQYTLSDIIKIIGGGGGGEGEGSGIWGEIQGDCKENLKLD